MRRDARTTKTFQFGLEDRDDHFVSCCWWETGYLGLSLAVAQQVPEVESQAQSHSKRRDGEADLTVMVVVAHLAALTFLLTVKDLWTSVQWAWSHAILLPSFPWAFPFLRVCCQHSPKKMSFFDTPKWCQSAKEIGILWGCRHVGGSWGSPAGRRAGKRLTTELGRRGHWAKVVIVSCLDVLAKSCREASQSWEVPRWFLQL